MANSCSEGRSCVQECCMKRLITNIILLGILNVLVFSGISNTFVGIVIFGILTLLPGEALLHAIKYNGKTIVERISLSAGFGTLAILILGLGINELLPILGIVKPLSLTPFMAVYNLAILPILMTPYIRNRRYIDRFVPPKVSIKDSFFIIISLILPVLAVMGAISLTNNSTNLFALFSYILIGIYSFGVFVANKKLSTDKLAIALFLISLSLLFMNSFRGWYNTGHDIQREFYVFNLTKMNGLWDMSLYEDPYNACLSLTILPTIYSITTKINDYFIFKILYQILFSFTVVNIFYLLRRYFSKSLAYIAAILFLFFPTFMTDMPMLNRQELAFLFLSMMLYMLFDNSISKTKRTVLVAFAGSGIVLSHYSTSYLVAALIMLTYVGTIAFTFSQGFLQKILHRSLFNKLKSEQNLNIYMVAFLLLFTVFWNSFYTKSSENLQKTLGDVSRNITKPFGEKEKAGETLYSIFNYKKVSPEKSLQKYMEDTAKLIRHPREEAAFYPAEIYEKYPITLIDQKILQPNVKIPYLENQVRSIDFMSRLRQSYATLLQILIVLGMVLFVIYKKHTFAAPKEFYIISGISILVITAQVVLPQSAIGYGVLRLFQQSLMVFSIFIVLGMFWLLQILIKSESIREKIIMSVMVVYFFLLSGVVPQLIGGYYPQLPLNNNGTYYNMYYTHASEIAALKWVGQYITKKSPLQSDSFDAAKIKTYAKTFPISASYPAVIKKEAYVYLNYSNAKLNSAYVYYNGGLLIYKYPIAFLDDHKNLIYSSSETKIYR
jgi:uncharacterized membrane protein